MADAPLMRKTPGPPAASMSFGHKDAVRQWKQKQAPVVAPEVVVPARRRVRASSVLLDSGAGAIRKDAVDTLEVLGTGSFGEVRLAKWREGATQLVNGVEEPRSGTLAIKTMHEALGGERALIDFQYEIQVLKKLRHPHISAFIGSGTWVSPEGQRTVYVAMEAVLDGDLEEAILAQELLVRPSYSDADVLRWAMEVASALHYLHTRTPMVIHRDVKPENILLDEGWSAKLADFGMSKLVRPAFLSAGTASRNGSVVSHADLEHLASDMSAAAAEIRVRSDNGSSGNLADIEDRDDEPDERFEMSGGGSYVYIAPEAFRRDKINEKVDQFSYGMVLWELMNRAPALRGRTRLNEEGMLAPQTPLQWAEDVAERDFRPEIRAEWPEVLRDIMRECGQTEPHSRPSFKIIQERLSKCQRPSELTNPATVSWTLKESIAPEGDGSVTSGAKADHPLSAGEVGVSLIGASSSGEEEDATTLEMAQKVERLRSQSRARLAAGVIVPPEEREAKGCACAVQ